jgi:hypothetical protein
MTDENQDPLHRAFHSVQFGDSSNPDDVANFRAAIRQEAMAAQQADRQQQELARSQAQLERIYRENPDIAPGSPESAQVERHTFDLLTEDLMKNGYSPEAFRKHFGRDATGNDIGAMHLALRSQNPGSVRSAEQFLTEAIDAYRGRKGHPDGRETTGPGRSFTSGVRGRVNQTREARGEAKLADDYAGSTLQPGADPEAAKASKVVQGMAAARRAARDISIRDVVVRRAG